MLSEIAGSSNLASNWRNAAVHYTPSFSSLAVIIKFSRIVYVLGTIFLGSPNDNFKEF